MSEQGPKDPNILAHSIMQIATGEVLSTENEKKKNPAAVQLGRLGGLKGGKARAAKLSKEERSRIARLAAEARWGGGDE